jgi:predicted ester cyclase
MSVEENKGIILHIWNECNRGNLAVIDECFADNFVRYAHDGTTMDRAGYRKMSAMILKNMPDCHVTIDDMVAEGDKVAFRITITGTETGGWGNMPPTNKRTVTKETYFARLENGKIVEYVNLNRMLN